MSGAWHCALLARSGGGGPASAFFLSLLVVEVVSPRGSTGSFRNPLERGGGGGRLRRYGLRNTGRGRQTGWFPGIAGRSTPGSPFAGMSMFVGGLIQDGEEIRPLLQDLCKAEAHLLPRRRGRRPSFPCPVRREKAGKGPGGTSFPVRAGEGAVEPVKYSQVGGDPCRER